MSDDTAAQQAAAEAKKLGRAYAAAEQKRNQALREMRERVASWRATGLTWREIEEATGRYQTVLAPPTRKAAS